MDSFSFMGSKTFKSKTKTHNKTKPKSTIFFKKPYPWRRALPDWDPAIAGHLPSRPTKPLLKPKQTHLADPNQNHKPPPPTHTKTHEPLLSHSTTLPLKDHKNQHRSTPKLTKTAYPHHHTVAKTTIERRKECESQRGLKVERMRE